MKFPPPAPNERFTKAERAQLVSLLTIGLENLWDGKDARYQVDKASCVCFSVPRHKLSGFGNTIKLRHLIEPRLDGAIVITDWLRHNHPGMVPENAPDIQAYRKAWMQNMIEEFSK